MALAAEHHVAEDEEGGNLDKVGGSPFTLDIGSDAYAQCIAMDPLGKFLYTTSFLPGQRVRGFSIGPTSGALNEVPGSPLSITVPYSVAVEPSGGFLLVGRDSGDLSVLAINRSSGALRELDESPFPRGGLQPEFAFAL
jgi:6-phosphogluconolactonase (cycloisomerase 2 family)